MSSVLGTAPLFESSTKNLYVGARALEYLGTAAFFGGLTFLAGLWPAGADTRGARRVLAGGWLLGAASTVTVLGLEGAWATGKAAGAMADPNLLRAVLQSDFGREWAAMTLLWVLALVALTDLLRRGERAARSKGWRCGAAAVGLGCLRIYGLTGHSRETAHAALAQIADVLHLLGMSVWIGGLLMLLAGVLPRRRPDELASVMPRYSTLALGSVVVVIGTGAFLAWNVIGSVRALTDTTYGHILIVKLLVLALVLGAAFGSKTWVEHRLDFVVLTRGEGTTLTKPKGLVRPVVLSVAVESGLLLLVLTIASFLVTADPGR